MKKIGKHKLFRGDCLKVLKKLPDTISWCSKYCGPAIKQAPNTTEWLNQFVIHCLDAGILEVKRSGEVKVNGALAKHQAHHKGYFKVGISAFGTRKHVFLHRLVCIAFHGLPKGKKCQVNHKSGIKTDNRAANLEWVSNEDNMKHAVRNGLHKQHGEKHSHAKLTDAQAADIRSSKAKTSDLADRYGVSRGTVYDIRSGKARADSPVTVRTTKPKTYVSARAKITPAQALQIFKSKDSSRVCAKTFGVCKDTVDSIRQKRSWYNLTRDLTRN